MKFSYNWLSEQFNDALPSPEILAPQITMHAFEVDEIIKEQNDTVLDIKVLPNRAHDCFSILGMAKAISSITSIPLKKEPDLEELPVSKEVMAIIQDEALSPRFGAVLVKNVTIGPSPEWLAAKVLSMGQKPINNIVDMTNYVMFLTGKPIHAFDADKLTKKDGIITVGTRAAVEGEEITDIHGKAWKLPAGAPVIYDANHPQQIALDVGGIKGGKEAEISADTKTVLITSANFDAVAVRKTSSVLGLRTDASSRFEKGLSSELVASSLQRAVEITKRLYPDVVIEGIADVYPNPEQKRSISFSAEKIGAILGVSVSAEEIGSVLNRIDMSFDKKEGEFTVVVPYERLDLSTVADMAEDIGSLLGYDRITATMLPPADKPVEIDKSYYYTSKIRDVLTSLGWDEVYTYAFVESGEVELANSLAQDKSFLRADLAGGMMKALELNGRNSDLLGLEQVKLFEIGKCFKVDTEYTSLALGALKTKNDKQKETVEEIVAVAIQKINEVFGIQLVPEHGIFEVNLDEIIAALPDPKKYDLAVIPDSEHLLYEPVSQYPFALRDIAVFVPGGVSADAVSKIILENTNDVKRLTLFDVFTKQFPDGMKKTSYAYRIVFQSMEKTLGEEDLNSVMKKVTIAMNANEGWQVR